MEDTIIAAIIGAIATVSAAILGKKAGFKKGQRHSILRFLDEQEKLLNRAIKAINRHHYSDLEAIVAAIIDNTKTWRRIQENFRALLNGLIDDLAGEVQPGGSQALHGRIRALKEAFPGKRLAVETELERSNI